MLLRKRRKRGELSMEGGLEIDGQTASVEVRCPSPNPEQICHQRQTSQGLLGSIQRLPQPLGEVAVLRMLHEKSALEIEETLGITQAAVKARVFRARARLVATQIDGKREPEVILRAFHSRLRLNVPAPHIPVMQYVATRTSYRLRGKRRGRSSSQRGMSMHPHG